VQQKTTCELTNIQEKIKKWQVPEVLFWSIPHPVKLASENPTRSSEEEAEYQT
jgi:hypothetical protein